MNITSEEVVAIGFVASLVNLYVSTKHVGRIEAAAKTIVAMKNQLEKVEPLENRISQVENLVLAMKGPAHPNVER